ncbi:MAG TPA: hypothetical protein VFO63_09655 [Blastocatellia bacterium]|nr:hypothetical protein [Blastocatellia bacterium]
MKGGVILIALALVIGYLGVTGRYKCFGVFFNCMIDPTFPLGAGSGGGVTDAAKPPGGGVAPIIVAPGSVGVNESGGQIYDARDPVRFLPPIEAFV